MIELELLGTSSDGESLVLTDAQGERYSVLISDELRGATRRDRPKMDIAPSRPTLAPRDIQALLRAGAGRVRGVKMEAVGEDETCSVSHCAS